VNEPARAIAHVGISVPDIDAAVDWYCKVFGMEAIVPTGELDASVGGPIVELTVDIFGDKFGGVKVAHLTGANGVGVELFQFVKPAYQAPDEPFEYWRGGIFHFAYVAKDAERLVEAIEANGGRRRSKLDFLFEGRDVRAAYCEDPWGTVIEVISHSDERVFSNLG
jgi:catechol 2,3-dioxygenase-like lactoylglutathione lyase family enzyme